MNLTDKQFFIVLGLGAVLVYWMQRRLVGGVSSFWEALTFDADKDLPPQINLTPGAQESRDWYVMQGYLELLPDGRTRITPAGEAYINQQQRATQ